MIETLVRRAWLWTLLSLALNLAWEIAQIPLYTIFHEASAGSIAYAVLHCAAGDGLIAAGSFVLAAAALRDPDWIRARPWRGGAIAIAAALAYTAYSEWRNVYQLGSWAYTEAMPLLFGIGLSPLLQWLLIPAAGVLVMRKLQSNEEHHEK